MLYKRKGVDSMKQEIRMAVGRRIRDYREELGLTREVFAEKVGISPQFLSEIEQAKKGISVETLHKICTAFQVSSDYFLFGKPNMNLSSPADDLLDKVALEHMEEYVTIIGMVNSLVEKCKKKIEG